MGIVRGAPGKKNYPVEAESRYYLCCRHNSRSSRQTFSCRSHGVGAEGELAEQPTMKINRLSNFILKLICLEIVAPLLPSELLVQAAR